MRAAASCWLYHPVGLVPPNARSATTVSSSGTNPAGAERGKRSDTQRYTSAQLRAQPKLHVCSAGGEEASPAKERCNTWKQTEMTQPGHEETRTVGMGGKTGYNVKSSITCQF